MVLYQAPQTRSRVGTQLLQSIAHSGPRHLDGRAQRAPLDGEPQSVRTARRVPCKPARAFRSRSVSSLTGT
jgi:hypothetical protein